MTIDDIQFKCTKEELGVTRAWLEKVMAAADVNVLKGIEDGKKTAATLVGDNKVRAEKIVRALQIVAADRGLVV